MYTKRDLLNDRRFQEAADDEIIFPLYARDSQAPTRVRDWAIQRKSDIELGLKPESDMEQVRHAFMTADMMDAWRIENDGKWRTGLFAGQEQASG